MMLYIGNICLNLLQNLDQKSLTIMQKLLCYNKMIE